MTYPPIPGPSGSGEFVPYPVHGMSPAIPGSGEPVLLTIGEISVTRSTVIVPTGQYPLRGTTWTVQDSTMASESVPTWAIVMTILFFAFCLLGLLFLLVKERRYSGFISVTVSGPNLFHAVQFPPGPVSAGWVTQQVNHARGLTAAA